MTDQHPIVPYARTAYAQGFAASGGPVTDRVQAGCVAALVMAVQHADDPGIIEATLRLGHLEGTWAAVYDRREALHARNRAAVRRAWRALNLASGAPDLVRAVRAQAGLQERRSDHSGVLAWIVALVQQLFGRVNVTAVHGLSETIRDALARSLAEGRAGALALAATEQAVIGFDFNLAFKDAYRALAQASTLVTAADTDAWLSTLLGDTADEVGAKLADLARTSAGYDEMLAAATGLLDGVEGRAVTTVVDLLTSRALAQGALDLYASEGVSTVDYVTAGDGRVCTPCDNAEKRGPYPVGGAPVPGLHPFCRCTVAPSAAVIPAALINQYVAA